MRPVLPLLSPTASNAAAAASATFRIASAPGVTVEWHSSLITHILFTHHMKLGTTSEAAKHGKHRHLLPNKISYLQNLTRAIFHILCCSFSIKNKWKANLSLGASQHWCWQASSKVVWPEYKNPSSAGVRHVPNSTIFKALKTCYFPCFLMLAFNQKQMKS